jgi:hypothetical protein
LWKIERYYPAASSVEAATAPSRWTVKRNIRRFPADFMFQLSKEEWENLKSQFATSSWGGTRKPPHAFTQPGIAMLSGLLNSDIAIDTNILIMRTFVRINEHALNYAELKRELEELRAYVRAGFNQNNAKINKILETFDEFLVHKKELGKPRTPIGYKQKNEK